MFFDKLLFRVSLAFLYSMYFALEVQAVPPGYHEAKPQTSIKRTSCGSEKTYQQDILTVSANPLGHVFGNEPPTEDRETRDSKKQKPTYDNVEFWADVIASADAAEEEYRKSHVPPAPAADSVDEATFWADVIASADAAEEEYRRSHVPPAPAADSVDEATFWADVIASVDAAEEEYFRRQQTPTSLTPTVSSQGSAVSEQASLVLSPGVQAAHVNLCSLVPDDGAALLVAVTAVEKKYSQGQASQSSPLPITHGQESLASQTSGFSLSASESEPDDDEEEYFEEFRYRQLTTPQDHQQHLIYVINKANRSVLITSNRLSIDMREGNDLFEAVTAACYRGVKFYFYAREVSLQERTVAAMDRLRNLKFDQAEVHSKLLVVDNKQITCGSYDWLSGPWYDENASLVLEGGYLEPVVKRIWDVLKKYRTIDFHSRSYRAVEKALRKLSPLRFQFKNPKNSFELINTPYKHAAFFQECFELAQKQITICVPFITGHKGFLQDILPQPVLLSVLRAGKKLHILYREGDEKVNLLTNLIDQTLSGRYARFRKNITLTPIERLHRKSLFIDDDMYIEGSYNWLSSARTLNDDWSFMEVSILFTGTWAQKLIREFPFSCKF